MSDRFRLHIMKPLLGKNDNSETGIRLGTEPSKQGSVSCSAMLRLFLFPIILQLWVSSCFLSLTLDSDACLSAVSFQWKRQASDIGTITLT